MVANADMENQFMCEQQQLVKLATACMNYQGYKWNLIVSKCLQTV